MGRTNVSRRQFIGVAAAGIPAAAVLRVVPLQAAEQAHTVLTGQKELVPAGLYQPKFFKARQYETLCRLCQSIIPADDRSGGAIEAHAPDFIDLLTSENEDYQRRLGGGLMWLDATCLKRYDKAYLECSPSEEQDILDLIAYRANGERDSSLVPGISFFAFLRDLTADGFFTSKVGTEYLRYIGNTFLTEFPGCPPVPGQ
jgi:gluconate 2-dehydrogenase gamma chain